MDNKRQSTNKYQMAVTIKRESDWCKIDHSVGGVNGWNKIGVEKGNECKGDANEDGEGGGFANWATLTFLFKWYLFIACWGTASLYTIHLWFIHSQFDFCKECVGVVKDVWKRCCYRCIHIYIYPVTTFCKNKSIIICCK